MLKIKKYAVTKVEFGKSSYFCNGVLILNKKDLESYCLRGLNGYDVKTDIARPGEKVRIVHITDTVRPVWKKDAAVFPGWTKGKNNCGIGTLHRCEGVMVMQTCAYPGIQEAIVDMADAGSKYSRFSKTINVVISVELENREYSKEQLAEDLKLIILRAAEYIGRLTENQVPKETEIVTNEQNKEHLPKIGYVCFIQAQGPLRNVHFYGRDCTKMKPEIIKAEEMMDGALVSGNYIISCQKNPTCFFQDNPIVAQLRKRAGTELNFGEIIISTESSLLEEKKKNAVMIAELAEKSGLDGVLISQEGGGHADVDLMLTLEECEKKGIKTVILTNEIAGQDGDLPPLVSTSAMADAIVTNGNNDEIISLDSVERTIGGNDILIGKFNACSGFETSLGILYTATNQLGANTMRTKML